MRRTTTIWAALAVLLGSAPGAIAAQWIGKTATVKNVVTGKLEAERRLKLGDNVFQNERIKTRKKSQAQLLFRDETVLTVGPNSNVVLDSFLYDPKAGKGGFTLNTVKGSFRFITGSMTSKSYKIKTPVATMGIRGTILVWRYHKGWLLVSVAEGGVDLCNLVANCVFLKPGTYAVTDGRKLSGAKKTGKGVRALFGDSSNPLYIFAGTALPIFGTTAASTPDDLPTPPDNPPPGNQPPVTDGFSPILTPSGNLPPGLGAQLDAGSLPPGIERNRDPVTRLPPGLQKKDSLPPGIEKKQ